MGGGNRSCNSSVAEYGDCPLPDGRGSFGRGRVNINSAGARLAGTRWPRWSVPGKIAGARDAIRRAAGALTGGPFACWATAGEGTGGTLIRERAR